MACAWQLVCVMGMVPSTVVMIDRTTAYTTLRLWHRLHELERPRVASNGRGNPRHTKHARSFAWSCNTKTTRFARLEAKVGS